MLRGPAGVLWLAALPVLAQAPIAPLVGTVLDPDGKPVANAAVKVSRCLGRGFSCLDLQLRHEWVELGHAQTDARGRFGLQAPLGLALRLVVDQEPFAVWASESVVPGAELTVQLEPGAVVTGQLIDASTGKGTPGRLRGWHPDTLVERFAGHTDGEGRYRFERLPSGPFWLDIEPDVAASPEWIQPRLAPGEIWTHEPRLEPGVELTGTVTDAETGEPIAGARIGESWVLHKAVRSDDAGRYAMHGCGDPGRPDLHCEAPGYARLRIDRDRNAVGPQQVDFALKPGVHIVGKVIDLDGNPIAGAYVAAIGSTQLCMPWQGTRTAADGSFVCDGFPRGLDGLLMVRGFGHASVIYALPAPAGDGQIDFGLVRLPPPQIVQGAAHDADGRPLVDVEVSLRGMNADAMQRGPMPSTWSQLQHYAGERTVRTDTAGRFAFGDVAPGDYAVAFGNLFDGTPDQEFVTVTAGKPVASIELVR